MNRQMYIYSSLLMLCKCSTKYFICRQKIYCLFFLSSYSKSYSLSILPQVWHLPLHLLLLPLVLHPWMGLNLISDLPVYKMRNVSKSIIWKMRGYLVFLYRIRHVLSICFPVNCILWSGGCVILRIISYSGKCGTICL